MKFILKMMKVQWFKKKKKNHRKDNHEIIIQYAKGMKHYIMWAIKGTSLSAPFLAKESAIMLADLPTPLGWKNKISNKITLHNLSWNEEENNWRAAEMVINYVSLDSLIPTYLEKITNWAQGLFKTLHLLDITLYPYPCLEFYNWKDLSPFLCQCQWVSTT